MELHINTQNITKLLVENDIYVENDNFLFIEMVTNQ